MMFLVYLAIAAGIAVGLTRYFPNATKRWYLRIQAARKTIFALLFASTTLVFLLSGVGTLMLVGGGMAVLAALQIIYEDSAVF